MRGTTEFQKFFIDAFTGFCGVKQKIRWLLRKYTIPIEINTGDLVLLRNIERFVDDIDRTITAQNAVLRFFKK